MGCNILRSVVELHATVGQNAIATSTPLDQMRQPYDTKGSMTHSFQTFDDQTYCENKNDYNDNNVNSIVTKENVVEEINATSLKRINDTKEMIIDESIVRKKLKYDSVFDSYHLKSNTLIVER